jgi:hypothetical protein
MLSVQIGFDRLHVGHHERSVIACTRFKTRKRGPCHGAGLALVPQRYRAFYLFGEFGMLDFPDCGFTVILLSGILSRPWSPLSSLPPEVTYRCR